MSVEVQEPSVEGIEESVATEHIGNGPIDQIDSKTSPVHRARNDVAAKIAQGKLPVTRMNTNQIMLKESEKILNQEGSRKRQRIAYDNVRSKATTRT